MYRLHCGAIYMYFCPQRSVLVGVTYLQYTLLSLHVHPTSIWIKIYDIRQLGTCSETFETIFHQPEHVPPAICMLVVATCAKPNVTPADCIQVNPGNNYWREKNCFIMFPFKKSMTHHKIYEILSPVIDVESTVGTT